MPITQDRLLRLIEITQRAIIVTKAHKKIAEMVLARLPEFDDEILRTGGNANTILKVRELLVPQMEMILLHEMSLEDQLDFRDEQVHFKHNASKNKANRGYQARTRARKATHNILREEDIRDLNEGVALEINGETIPIHQPFIPASQSVNSDHPKTKPTKTSNPDPIREQYEQERDARLKEKSAGTIFQRKN